MSTDEHGLGRRPAPDARDARFPMRLALAPAVEAFFPRGIPAGTRHYRQGLVLDQGRTGTCVAHAWCGWAYGAPLMTKPDRIPSPFTLYRQIVLGDAWPENDIEAQLPDDALQFGTSVRAGVQALQRLGVVKHYLWAQSVEDVRAWHLAGFGGVVLGVNWTSEMFTPDRDGVIRYRGTIEGGHAIKTTGWKDEFTVGGRTTAAVRILNNWGRAWGEAGRAWILVDDLARLLADDGECCAAVEQALPVAA